MRVLLAYDGSAQADVARDLVDSLPWPAQTKILVITILDAPDVIGIPDPGAPLTLESGDLELRARIQSSLNKVAGQLRKPGRTVQTRIVQGRAASVVLGAAREMVADLIVVGNRGRGQWKSLLLGSVSTEIVDHAPCPVLVARHDQVARVIFATDGSATARRALEVVTSWRILAGLPAVALLVDPPVGDAGDWAVASAGGLMQLEDMREPKEEASRLAEAAAEQLRRAGFHALSAVRVGDPSQEIAASARAPGDLLVMGSRGLATLPRLALGSVARSVLLRCGASVLVVRERATAEVAAKLAASHGSAPRFTARGD